MLSPPSVTDPTTRSTGALVEPWVERVESSAPPSSGVTSHLTCHVSGAFRSEARVAEVELDATRGDAELSSLPVLRDDLELGARERDLLVQAIIFRPEAGTLSLFNEVVARFWLRGPPRDRELVSPAKRWQDSNSYQHHRRQE